MVPIDLPGLLRNRYAAWPLADHIADKVCAMLEGHPRQTGAAEPSTRYRDLADLAIIAHRVEVDARRLRAALAAEAVRRGLVLPEGLHEPAATGWVAGYARVARGVSGLEEKTLASALETLRRFIDPVLSGTAKGNWRKEDLLWSW
ncbi:MAG: nucleotidyl transferase AbiEii/AbiGii toxin family protein [Candidatus Dormibacterales bacterium]